MYGVAQGTLFCGESMFSRMENASKTALLVFCEEFIGHGRVREGDGRLRPRHA
ncbi:hypothetical protein [Escherichia coli]